MARFSLAQLDHPIVQAPLAGGVSTPALAAAVSGAGGLGFLAAGYKQPDHVRRMIAELRGLSGEAPFGVNLFATPGPPAAADQVERYARSLSGEAERYGVALGEPLHDDDGYDDKLALLEEERVPVVSFTFGCPPRQVVERLHELDMAVWVTVTTPAEAVKAREAGADALVVQGVEAGGHQSSFDDEPSELGLLSLLQLVSAAVDLPLVAAGGIASGRGVAAVLAAGAEAAQIGTAFMLTPEAGTAPAHREALAGGAETRLTRAFTGRTARGIVNRFMREHSAEAEHAYPEVHHLTAPLRAAAREGGDPDGLHLWAGQAHALAEPIPAAEVVARLVADARAAVRGIQI